MQKAGKVTNKHTPAVSSCHINRMEKPHAGRRARHSLVGERSAVVVDNAVIASALARHAARAGAVDPDSTRVTVGHRRATVEITPTSGFAVDTAAVEAAVTTQLESFGLRPLLAPRVIVHTHGKVGA